MAAGPTCNTPPLPMQNAVERQQNETAGLQNADRRQQ
jgi:hypothetical protein